MTIPRIRAVSVPAIFVFLFSSCLALATLSHAKEFDILSFPVESPVEETFRAALYSPPGDREAALSTMRSLLGNPALPPDAVTYAISRLAEGDEAHAARLALVQTGREGPFYLEALDSLAADAETAAQWDEAARLLRKLSDAMDMNEERPRGQALARLLDALDRSGKAKEARDLAITLWTRYAHLPASERAAAYLARGGLSPALTLTPREVYLRGKTLLDGGSREAAVETLSALRNRISEKDALRPEVSLALGKSLHFLRRNEEALAPLAEAAKRGGTETAQWARFYRARSLFGLDRGDEGARDLLAAAKKWPSSSQAPTWLLQAYRVFQGRSMDKEAVESRKRLLSAYPASDEAVEARWMDAWAEYRAGTFAKAAESFGRAVAGAGKTWNRAGGLYWASVAYQKSGNASGAEKARETLLREFPVGYYSRLARNGAAGRPPTMGLADPRGLGDAPLLVSMPQPGDLALGGALGRAAAYLRLGLPQAARHVLDRSKDASPAALRLRYWAEDFHGSLDASGCDWTSWPWPGEMIEAGAGGDSCRVSYAAAYPESVAAGARESGIHPHLLLAIARTESRFDPVAYSPWEARGLMQFIPATARLTAKDLGMADFSPDMLYDPPVALRLGARHLRELLDRFDGNVVSAVAAYNAGAAAVASWRAKWPQLDEAEFVDSIPYRETRKYVKKVLTSIDAYGRLDSPGLWRAESPLP